MTPAGVLVGSTFIADALATKISMFLFICLSFDAGNSAGLGSPLVGLLQVVSLHSLAVRVKYRCTWISIALRYATGVWR